MTTIDNPAAPLSWESAGTDEPGDQLADSRIVPDGPGSFAYYAVGPNEPGRGWSLELAYFSPVDGDVGGVLFGAHESADHAKARAQIHEDANVGRPTHIARENRN